MLSTIGSLMIIFAGSVFVAMNSDSSDSSTYVPAPTETTNTTSKEDKTFDYWMSLDAFEREEYYNSNEYLKSYGDRYFYQDKYQMAKSVSEIARRENREFTDKYNRY